MIGAKISNSEVDSIIRFRIAFEERDTILAHIFTPSGVWLPLPFNLIRIVNLFTNNHEAYLYFSCILSCLTFNYILSTVRIFSESHKTDCITLVFCFLFSLTPIVYFTSLTPLSEPIYMLFCAAGIYQFFRILILNHPPYSFILIMSLANLVRYEAWILSALLAFILLFETKNLRLGVKLAIISIPPLLWTTHLFIEYGDPFYWLRILKTDAEDVRLIEGVNSNWAGLMSVTLPITLIFLALTPLYFLKSRVSKLYPFGALVIIFLSLLVFKLLSGDVEPSNRYAIPSLTLIFVYLAIYIGKQSFHDKKEQLILYFSAFLLIVTIPVTFQAISADFKDLAPVGLDEAINEIKKIKIDENNILFIPRVEYTSDLIKIRLNLVPSLFLIDIEDDEKFIDDPFMMWKLYFENNVLNEPNLRSIVFIKSSNINLPRGYYLPEIVKNNYELKWSNEVVDIYEKNK